MIQKSFCLQMLSKDSMECSGTPRSSRVAFGQLSSDRPAATTLHSAAFVLAQDHASGGAENQPPVVVGVPNTTSKYKVRSQTLEDLPDVFCIHS